jgi:hypothetical protein
VAIAEPSPPQPFLTVSLAPAAGGYSLLRRAENALALSLLDHFSLPQHHHLMTQRRTTRKSWLIKI